MAIVTRQQYLARSTIRDVGGVIDWAWRIVAWQLGFGSWLLAFILGSLHVAVLKGIDFLMD